MKDWRENSLLARQTEAVKQMLSLNQVSSVSIFFKNPNYFRVVLNEIAISYF